jgi:hypothetical protein
MRGRIAAVVVLLLAGFMIWCVGRPRGGYAADSIAGAADSSSGATTQPVGVAVVELFTSQGCSSCPPAEKVLAGLVHPAETGSRPIYTLAFHVDYWNHLGWSDPFSDARYSQRQQDYSRSLGLNQIYTPQMIVNGKKEFVGSDSNSADAAIAEALAIRTQAAVTLKIEGKAGDGWKVHATINGAGTDPVVNIAVVEQGLSTQVNAGENSGQKLDEPSVVRWFKTVPLSAAGEVPIPSLPGVRSDRASVVVYVQKPGNGAIIGAAASPLP